MPHLVVNYPHYVDIYKMYSLHLNIEGSGFQNLNFELFMIRKPLNSHFYLIQDSTEELSIMFPVCQQIF